MRAGGVPRSANNLEGFQHLLNDMLQLHNGLGEETPFCSATFDEMDSFAFELLQLYFDCLDIRSDGGVAQSTARSTARSNARSNARSTAESTARPTGRCTARSTGRSTASGDCIEWQQACLSGANRKGTNQQEFIARDHRIGRTRHSAITNPARTG